MILSYHPFFVADENRLCAGRAPDETDRAAMQRAEAVILPQGSYRSLYEMARQSCRHVFPNHDLRFSHPGKIGQERLFREMGVPHPDTRVYASMADVDRDLLRQPPFDYPFVFKFDWGGGGDTVFRVDGPADFKQRLDQAAACELTGQCGFVLQALVPGGHRCLRVAVIGRERVAYWRVQPDAERFTANLARGAFIDRTADPERMAAGTRAVDAFCRQTGIDLAGIDLLFDERAATPRPLFLEINWFFGREGLGGSDRFYARLNGAIETWLAERGLWVAARAASL